MLHTTLFTLIYMYYNTHPYSHLYTMLGGSNNISKKKKKNLSLCNLFSVEAYLKNNTAHTNFLDITKIFRK